MPPLPEAIILVLAPFAPLFSKRVWGHAQVLLLGAILTPGARTVTAALRVMGLAAERRFTNDQRVLTRAICSARQGSRMLLGLLSTRLVPPGAPIVLGADDTVERRSGRKITAKGCYRDMEQGYSMKTAQRAKKALGIVSNRAGETWWWRLPDFPVIHPPPRRGEI